MREVLSAFPWESGWLQNGGKFPCETHLRQKFVRKLGSQCFGNIWINQGLCHKHRNSPIWYRNDAKNPAIHHKRAIRDGRGSRATTPNGGETPCETNVGSKFMRNFGEYVVKTMWKPPWYCRSSGVATLWEGNRAKAATQNGAEIPCETRVRSNSMGGCCQYVAKISRNLRWNSTNTGIGALWIANAVRAIMQNGGKLPWGTHLRHNFVRKLGSQCFRNMHKTKGNAANMEFCRFGAEMMRQNRETS